MNEQEQQKALELLKEALTFMNLVPNREYGEHYPLCSKIRKFLKEIEGWPEQQ